MTSLPQELEAGTQMRVLGAGDRAEWSRVLGDMHQHDFYHLASYHHLAESRGEGRARLFVYDEGEHRIALPLLVRQIGDDAEGAFQDATSIYGYGGPLASAAALPASVVARFHERLKDVFSEERIVSVFSRLHPLIAQRELLAGLGEIRPAGRTVSIDLTLSPEAQRAQYSATYRTRINKLRRNGVTCEIDEELRHIPEFSAFYQETMRRVNAHDSYFFGEDYFTGLAEALGSVLKLLVIKLDGQVIAGSLFTLCDGIAQYHLGATPDAVLRLSPMGLTIDTAREWAHAQGARVLHLGGGVGSKEDSLFNYKAGFSDCRHRFETWRWITEPAVYTRLSEERGRANELLGLDKLDADYFPTYRCPAVPRRAPPILPEHV
jgi:hypothetical protein